MFSNFRVCEIYTQKSVALTSSFCVVVFTLSASFSPHLVFFSLPAKFIRPDLKSFVFNFKTQAVIDAGFIIRNNFLLQPYKKRISFTWLLKMKARGATEYFVNTKIRSLSVISWWSLSSESLSRQLSNKNYPQSSQKGPLQITLISMTIKQVGGLFVIFPSN